MFKNNLTFIEKYNNLLLEMLISEKDFSNKIDNVIVKAKAFLLSKYQINEFDLQDILQEATYKALKNLPSFKNNCSFETWFISICKYEANGLFRKNRKNVTYNDSYLKNIPYDDSGEKRENDIEDAVLIVNKALSKLNDKHRQIIELTLKSTKTSREISELLKIPISSARTRLFYAKKQMKKILEKNALQPNV